MHVVEPPGQEAQIVVLGPNPYQRAGIRSALERTTGSVIDDLADPADVTELCGLRRVDLIVLDGPSTGQAAAATALGRSPTARPGRLIALLGQDERSGLIALLQTRVRGLVNADGRPEELTRAVRCVLDGGLYISPAFAETVVNSLFGAPEPPPPTSPPGEPLTPREDDVLGKLLLGLANADIARQLYISEKTVKFHVSNILSKYQLRSRAQLIAANAGPAAIPVESPAAALVMSLNSISHKV